MRTPVDLKTVQARILAYTEAIGWTVVSRLVGSNGTTKEAVAGPSAAPEVVH